MGCKKSLKVIIFYALCGRLPCVSVFDRLQIPHVFLQLPVKNQKFIF